MVLPAAVTSRLQPVVAATAVHPAARPDACVQDSTYDIPGDSAAQQQQTPQQLLRSQRATGTAPAAAAAAHRPVAVTRHSRLPLKQQHARRLVAAAQQQQRAAKLARYQVAVKSWCLADMMAEVGLVGAGAVATAATASIMDGGTRQTMFGLVMHWQGCTAGIQLPTCRRYGTHCRYQCITCYTPVLTVDPALQNLAALGAFWFAVTGG
jgi:hypothetical protein